MKCSPTKGSERFREKSRPGGPKTFFPHTGAHTFFSHGVPQRRRPDQRGPDVSFENQNFFGTCNPGEPYLSSIGPGCARTHFRHANSTRRGIRCARASLSRASVPAPSRTARRRRVIRLLGFWKQRPASRRSPWRLRVPRAPFPPSLTPCPLPPRRLRRKERWLSRLRRALILVGDGGTGACARLPRASEASRSAAERLVFKI